MSDITELLALSNSDTKALSRVFALLYDELKKIAQTNLTGAEKTLSPTVLIHEVYLRLLGNKQLILHDRRHFLSCAARAMRVVWVDHARRTTALKRGGRAHDLPLDEADAVPATLQPSEQALELDQALDRLDALSSRQRELVELRYFAGLEFLEIAQLLGCSERTAKREWERARAFLYAQMQ